MWAASGGGLDPKFLDFWSWGAGGRTPGHLVQPQQRQQQEQGGFILSGTVISPVGSLIIGIICSPGFFL